MHFQALLCQRVIYLLALILFPLSVGSMGVAAHAADPLPATERDGIRFVDARNVGIEGQGWPAADFATPFDRRRNISFVTGERKPQTIWIGSVASTSR